MVERDHRILQSNHLSFIRLNTKTSLGRERGFLLSVYTNCCMFCRQGAAPLALACRRLIAPEIRREGIYARLWRAIPKDLPPVAATRHLWRGAADEPEGSEVFFFRFTPTAVCSDIRLFRQPTKRLPHSRENIHVRLSRTIPKDLSGVAADCIQQFAAEKGEAVSAADG